MSWSRRELCTAIALLGLCGPLPVLAAGDRWKAWLAELRREALATGISSRTFERAFAGVEPVARIVELDRRQPEGRLSFAEYLRRVVTPARIRRGRERLAAHAALLGATERRYGVPARLIVALWGIESSYGEFRGRFPVVAALATLAFDGRRAAFFRGELLTALRILERGEVAPERMYGSWAGAMGQPQFMPSTYLRHAVDADGDGRRDIWDSLPDTFASMANYLKAAGWRTGYIWGRPVTLTRTVEPRLVGLRNRAPLARWHRLGVRRSDGRPLPRFDLEAHLLLPDGEGGPAFLVYENFRVLLRWNRSTYFALAVGRLADALVGREV